jgi:hypothetical protein
MWPVASVGWPGELAALLILIVIGLLFFVL